LNLNSYAMFNGQCEEAFKVYEKCFGGKIEAMITHAGSPMEAHTPPEWRGKIMHARMSVGNSILMGSDAPPDRYEEAKGTLINIGVEDPLEAERVFQELSEGGTIKMPIQKTFWAERFGMLVDRFGIPWMVNCELRNT
jgi:PhnB protein